MKAAALCPVPAPGRQVCGEPIEWTRADGLGFCAGHAYGHVELARAGWWRVELGRRGVDCWLHDDEHGRCVYVYRLDGDRWSATGAGWEKRGPNVLAAMLGPVVEWLTQTTS